MLNGDKGKTTVLVTGGAGYIGSWATRTLLASGFKVIAYDNVMYTGRSLLGVLGHPRFRFVKGDVRNALALNEAMKGVSYVVHLAALVGEAVCDKFPRLTQEVNFEGTQNVARAAKANGARRLIFFSTCSSYGVQDTNVMADEQTKLNPVSLYAASKIEAEKFLLSQPDNGMVTTVFRPSTVHGASARMRFDLIVNHMILEAFTNKRIVVYGPQMWRPLMWVGDAAQAIALALDAEESQVKNEVFNLGGVNGNCRKQEIGELIKRSLPDLKIDYEGQDKDLRSYRVDFSKIQRKLGFTLSKTLDQAIADVFQLLETGLVKDFDSAVYRNV